MQILKLGFLNNSIAVSSIYVAAAESMQTFIFSEQNFPFKQVFLCDIRPAARDNKQYMQERERGGELDT